MRPLTEDDVYKALLGDIIIGEMYNSPIPGREDDTPSFKLFEKDGHIKWIDFGLTDQWGKDPANLLQYLHEMPLTSRAWYQAWEYINTQIKWGMVGKPPTQLTRRRKRQGVPYVRGSDVFEAFETNFWDRIHIPATTLVGEDIQALRFMNWSGEENVSKCDLVSTPQDPAFIYWWARSPASWKLYRPMASKRVKFRQEWITGVIEGWATLQKQLPPNGKLDVLFILSSTKDRLVVKEAFGDTTMYNGINPRGEKDRQDILAQKDYLRTIAKRIIVIYDADNPGFMGSKVLAEAGGFEYYDMRGKLGQHYDYNKNETVPTKDFSDYVDVMKGSHALFELRNLICTLCNI